MEGAAPSEKSKLVLTNFRRIRGESECFRDHGACTLPTKPNDAATAVHVVHTGAPLIATKYIKYFQLWQCGVGHRLRPSYSGCLINGRHAGRRRTRKPCNPAREGVRNPVFKKVRSHSVPNRNSPKIPPPPQPTRAPALMSIQPRLPTELLEAVIDEASDNPRTLRNLSLTCITLVPRSRVRLFSGLVIRTVQQLEESRVFLDSRPWLLPLVQKVTISIFIPHDNTKPNIRLLDVFPIHLFTRLPNLRAWTMETEVLRTGRPSLSLHHFALRCYRIYGGHIDSLELSRIRFRNKLDFRGLISAFTSLDSLTCYGIQFHSSKQQPVIAATVPTNIRPLPISTLNVSLSPIDPLGWKVEVTYFERYPRLWTVGRWNTCSPVAHQG